MATSYSFDSITERESHSPTDADHHSLPGFSPCCDASQKSCCGCLLRAQSANEGLVGLQYGNNGTHVEDMEDPIQVRFPGGDCLLVILRMKKSR
jgi:hypothetical protein